MRILAVRFKNINSLAGEWLVDFMAPEYTSDGIFAITGPTGAGKTTLLDVICLALYGRTPRLERVNKSVNDVMTRQTDECFAEVTFSTANGNFRCHWSQHRARKKPDGELQSPKHEISNADSGQVIDNQIRSVSQRIVATTGMDYERFTRSMLLAQGDFAAFLKASADERAPILEQITGTGIYSDISIKVHERHTLERNELQRLQTELSGLQLLTPEQEQALRANEAAKSAELATLNAQLRIQRQQHDWKQQCIAEQQKRERLQQELAHWQQRQQDFAAQHQRLQQATQALTLAGPYSALQTLRQNQQDDDKRLQQTTSAIPALNSALQAQEKIVQQTLEMKNQADTELTDMRPIFKKVHVLDNHITLQKKQLAETRSAEAALLKEQAQLHQHHRALQAENQARTDALKTLSAAADSDHTALLQCLEKECELAQKELDGARGEFEKLTQGLSASQWQQRRDPISSAISHCDVLQQRQAERDTVQDRLQTQQSQIDQLGTDISAQQNQLQQDNDLMLARELAVSALQQQQALLHTIKSMESKRALLQDQHPCPLCGSLEHPYASHTPDADVEALQTQVNNANALLTASRQQYQDSQQKLLRLQQTQLHCQQQYADTQQSLQMLNTAISSQHQALKIEGSVAQHKNRLEQDLAVIDQTLDAIDEQRRIVQQLDQSLQDARTRFNDIRLDIGKLEQTQVLLQSSQQQLQKISAQTDNLRQNLQHQHQQLDNLLAERKQLMGEHDADALETKLERALANAEQAANAARQQQQQAEKSVHDAEQLAASLLQSIGERELSISTSQTRFDNELQARGFASEQNFLAARLSDENYQQLQRQAESLQQQGTEINALIRQSQSDLDSLLQQALTTESLPTLQAQLQQQEHLVSELQQILGGLRRDLDNNAQARTRQQQHAQKIDAQTRELQRWATLHELIGSADGKKFRNFAQGLTFELMITQANQQLSKMSDRYLLLRDNEQPLELNVIDHYQAGEIRSTKNLSGGEGFIVSLALALGLSRMASRNVRVDSLFLDEGFGTLDDDALDTALETLASLQQEGKLIGVISHIPALKERIGTQIKVTPGTGGRSRLSGPGCHAL